jgi:hypothetical protein
MAFEAWPRLRRRQALEARSQLPLPRGLFTARRTACEVRLDAGEGHALEESVDVGRDALRIAAHVFLSQSLPQESAPATGGPVKPLQIRERLGLESFLAHSCGAVPIP